VSHEQKCFQLSKQLSDTAAGPLWQVSGHWTSGFLHV